MLPWCSTSRSSSIIVVAAAISPPNPKSAKALLYEPEIGMRLTLLAGLVLIVRRGTVQRRKLSKLVTFELVLALWSGSSLIIM